MIGAAFKFVWNRKRSNALLVLEIFISFLVAVLISTLVVEVLSNYRKPLGFSSENVWRVSLGMDSGASDDVGVPENVEIFQRLAQEVRSLAPIEGVAGSNMAPYEGGAWRNAWHVDGQLIEVEVGEVTQEFDRVLGLDLIAGRWFNAGDEGLNWRPVVIDRDLATRLYGDEDPLGKLLRERDEGSPEERVVGIIQPFRKLGELWPAGYFGFRLAPLKQEGARAPRFLLVRVQPGTTASFEEELVRRMQAVAPTWSFQVEDLALSRKTALRLFSVPLLAGGLVAGFLLIMVGLGLSGVLWQNVVRRTREIGLRRAVGATRSDVYRQIVMELLILTGFGLVLGSLVVVQVPLLDALVFVSPGSFAQGVLAAYLVILALALACGLYPGWLASRVPPADALRHE